MPYVAVPKDLSKIKTKMMLNLTKRQLICFGAGAAVAIPTYFLLKGPLGTSLAAMLMMLVMIPAFLMGVYEKHGQPLEVIIRNMVSVILFKPKQRPYRTENFYALLEKQAKIDKEVARIVQGESPDKGSAEKDHASEA